MCGLFGASTQNTYGLATDQRKIIEQAAYVDALRGFDSTGIATVDKKWKGKMFKRALPAADFLTSRQGLSAMKSIIASDTRIVIGHNRAATVGDVNDEAAHPFRFDHIIGAHNGTLRTRRGLVNKTAEVDSMDLIHAFSATEPKAYTKMLSEVEGAYALTMADLKRERLMFVRNGQRPLHLMWDDDDLYWASEAGMLYWLLERNKVDIDNVEHLELGVNVLYTYNPKTNEIESEEEYEFDPPKLQSFGNSRSSSGHGTRNNGSGNPLPRRSTATYAHSAELLKKKLICKEDMPLGSGAYAFEAEYWPYTQTTNSGTVKAKWYIDDSTYVPVFIENVSAHTWKRMIDSGRQFLFGITGGKISNSGHLVEVMSSVAHITQFDSVSDGDTDKNGNTNKAPAKKEEATSGVIDLGTERKKRLEEQDIDTISNHDLEKALGRGCGSCDRHLGYGDLEHIAMYNGRAFCGNCAEQYEQSIEDASAKH